MAGSVNRVTLLGRVGGDPEVKSFNDGGKVAKFSLATGDTYTNKHGEKVENTEWHRIEMWEGLAGVAEKYVRKGGQVYIEGMIRTDTWTDKDGNQKTGVTIRAHNMTLCGGNGNPPLPENGITNNRPAQPAQAPAASAPAQNRPAQPLPPTMPADDEDLPF